MYHLQILTPEEVFYNGEIEALIAPAKEGYLGVLTDHAPLITSLKAGLLIISERNNQKKYYDISSGFLEVSYNKVSILIKTIQMTNPVDIGLSGTV